MAITDSYITLDDIVANAATIIKSSNRYDRNLFKQWAYIGETELGFHSGSVKTCKIDVVDLSIKKPFDLLVNGIVDLALYTDQNNEVNYTYRGDGKFVHEKRVDRRFTVEVTEDAHYLHLDSLGDGVAYCIIRYYGVPCDEDGMPMIPKHHLLPLMMFVRYMDSMRNPEVYKGENTERTWAVEAAKARSKNTGISQLEATELAKDWMTMIKSGIKRFDRY